ncbi:uncharacterized protein TNCV_2231911 [Trichonephila clavipes]|nr:uncharacterized protein TNCV_2231911 [Trichonephila clavipes]
MMGRRLHYQEMLKTWPDNWSKFGKKYRRRPPGCFITLCHVVRQLASRPETEDWIPGFLQTDPSVTMDSYDQGFVPVQCIAKTSQGEDSPPLITIYPPKGFSHLFFPVNGFNPDRYLLPMVAVKLNRIRKAENVTVECSVDAPNAFFLWNNGRAVIKFKTI